MRTRKDHTIPNNSDSIIGKTVWDEFGNKGIIAKEHSYPPIRDESHVILWDSGFRTVESLKSLTFTDPDEKSLFYHFKQWVFRVVFRLI